MTSRIEFKIMWSESVETMKTLSGRISVENRTEQNRTEQNRTEQNRRKENKKESKLIIVHYYVALNVCMYVRTYVPSMASP